MKLRLLILVSLLAGCTTLPAEFNNLTADQLKAVNSDKNITVICNNVDTLTTNVFSVYAIIDKSTITSGSVVIGRDCSIQVISLPKETK